MAFLARAQIETRAAELWRRRGLVAGFDAETLVDDLGLRLLWEGIVEDPGDRILGALRPDAGVVILNENRLDELEKSEGLRRFTSVTRSATGSSTPPTLARGPCRSIRPDARGAGRGPPRSPSGRPRCLRRACSPQRINSGPPAARPARWMG